MESTYSLLDQLLKRDEQEICVSLYILMAQGKLDYVKLSNIYVEYLKDIKEDQENKLIEAETCVVESFSHKKGDKTHEDAKHTQRCLYLLNESRRFCMDSLNEEYKYDEEFGKQQSWYVRNKIRKS